MKKILMVALDFPPCKSAGVQRTLKFAEYLSEFGWEPIILTVSVDAHDLTDDSQVIPESIKHVYRSNSFNASRDFAFKGKYLSITKQPDKWWTWRYTAIPLGKKIIDELKPDLIWSTYPVSTAHSIAKNLVLYSGLPWVADFRDPVQCRYDKTAEQILGIDIAIEKSTFKHASSFVFTSHRASLLYQTLYPDMPLNKFNVIENGYDEGNFELGEVNVDLENSSPKFTLLHSGAIYANGRDPEEIFKAISELKKNKYISSDSFEMVFRGTDGNIYQDRVSNLEIEDIVIFKPPINYVASLKEMLAADALLVIQGPLFGNQIPGKVFEYIRSHLPILALTTKLGATAELLENVDLAYVCETAGELVTSVNTIRQQPKSQRKNIQLYSRYEKTQQLASLLDELNG